MCLYRRALRLVLKSSYVYSFGRLEMKISLHAGQAVGWHNFSGIPHSLEDSLFSCSGYVLWNQNSAGRNYAFSTVLHKKTYPRDRNVDWQVWYFQENLPLRWDDALGVSMVFSEWCDLPEVYFSM